MNNHPSAAVRALLARKDGLSASLSEVLGAISIAVVILGLTGVGIAASFNVGQDSEASTGISSLRSAQTMYEAKHGSYATLSQLTSGTKPAMGSAPAGTKLMLGPDALSYCALVKSGSMAGTQFLTGSGGTVVELKTKVDTEALKGCTWEPDHTIMAHTPVPLQAAPAPAGSSQSCLRFTVKPGPSVRNWLLGVTYLDADQEPVPNTRMPIPGGGYYTNNGRLAALDVDGVCYPIGPEVKFVRWNFASSASANYGAGEMNTIGSRYSDTVVIFQ